jgi:hypothetical protein
MIDLLAGLAPLLLVIGGWFLIQTVILPRFGIRT